MIRAGITDVEDLPEEFRCEVEDMLAQHRSLPRSAWSAARSWHRGTTGTAEPQVAAVNSGQPMRA